MTKIESDNIGSNLLGLTHAKNTKLAKESDLKSEILPKEAVTISNHLSKLVNLLKEGHKEEDQLRINSVKNQIQSGSYKVDINALSDKLIRNGIIS